MLVKRVLVSSFVIIAVLGCSPIANVHSPEKAAKEALKFLELLLVDHDLDGAYKLFSEQTKETVTFEDFILSTEKFQDSGTYDSLWVVGYEPVERFRCIVIYIEATMSRTLDHWRVEVCGSAISGYSVKGLQHSRTPFPHLTDMWESLKLE